MDDDKRLIKKRKNNCNNESKDIIPIQCLMTKFIIRENVIKTKRVKSENDDNRNSENGTETEYNDLENYLHPSWREAINLQHNDSIKMWKKIKLMLNDSQRQTKHEGTNKQTMKPLLILPNKCGIFNAYNSCLLNHIKVVIILPEPLSNYYEIKNTNNIGSLTHGYSLSTPVDAPLQIHSTRIFGEIKRDLNLSESSREKERLHGNLQDWVKQGVLLMNLSLTVISERNGSHKSIGWAGFTDTMLKIIAKKCKTIVFMLWGTEAQKKESIIIATNKNKNNTQHLILSTVNPLIDFSGKFIGCQHFSLANNYLKVNNMREIDW